MSHAIPARPRRRHLAVALAATALFAVGVPAAAQAACPSAATTKAFKQFGDNADYSIAPAGDFESGATGWTLASSSVGTGNEKYMVHGSGDSHSLAIKATGTALSPAFCVDITEPMFRFFATQTSGSWATLVVKLRWTDSRGSVNTTTVGSLNGLTDWLPSMPLPLSTTLPLWQSRGTLSVQLLFDPENYGGNWSIDDVYIDPYARG
jgi:hypothetical protein